VDDGCTGRQPFVALPARGVLTRWAERQRQPQQLVQLQQLLQQLVLLVLLHPPISSSPTSA
jgi:hypothetical protein